MQIRNEVPADIEAIYEVTEKAFRTVEISRKTEQFIINALRQANALTISLVAVLDHKIVGHVAFSPVNISDGTQNWYGLGPVSVLPEYQRKGIGIALINEGLEQLRKIGAKGCALVGDPNYYVRFGFKNNPSLIHEGIPQEVFLVLPFDKETPKGVMEFHEGFLAEN